MNYADKAIILYDRKKEKTPKDDEKALCREVLQELILDSLCKTDFFDNAAFEGGTFLRLIHNSERFSEDLDFACVKQNLSFDFEKYFAFLQQDFKDNGLELEYLIKNNNTNVRKAYIKDISVATALNLPFVSHPRIKEKILLKFETDTNPPSGATYDYLDGIRMMDLSSGFAGKCHALIERAYLKGRDWFDLLYYTDHKVEPNYNFLKNALIQRDERYKDIEIDSKFVIHELTKRLDLVKKITDITDDLDKFVDTDKINYLNQSGKDIFYKAIENFKDYSKNVNVTKIQKSERSI